MTDNEKRAHELAVAVAIDLSGVARESAHGRPVSFNYYDAYIAAYKEILARLEAEPER